MSDTTKQIVIKNTENSDVLQFKADNMNAEEQNYMLSYALVAHANRFGYDRSQVLQRVEQIWDAFDNQEISTDSFPLDS